MDKETAFNVLVDALNIANAKGAFGELKNSATIFSALQVLATPDEVPAEAEPKKK